MCPVIEIEIEVVVSCFEICCILFCLADASVRDSGRRCSSGFFKETSVLDRTLLLHERGLEFRPS